MKNKLNDKIYIILYRFIMENNLNDKVYLSDIQYLVNDIMREIKNGK